ncbi:MAG: glucose-1-phosphate adenylyltransferase subunit GlgD, partial [Clostridia bacterium]|nr:glucose-1-phosphate adenylyltransferase subunit GlgD [Clostridia bacterium]
MSQVAGIIFSNLNHATNTQLTADRTVAAIPFACRYRLVDFALSNMVNGDVSNINIITNYNYRSLNEHIGSGKDWDLARHGAGIRLLSPYQNGGTAMYQSKLEALVDVLPSLLSIKEEYVLICDSDVVCNIDIKDMLVFHQENEADITT